MGAIFEALGLNVWTLLFQTINVLIVLVGLYYILWKPLRRAMNERQEKIEGDLREAASAKEKAEEVIASCQEQIKQAQEEARNILQKANEAAEATRAEIIAQAKEEAARVMEQARLELEREKSMALAALRSQAADLVVAAAGKVMARALSSEDQEHLLQEALAEVERLQ
ncbi:MAG: F0F1 ATP synthase subunit B [Dethiobacteria bacterium]|jgi:F-type H+-transporting ATPase subunit b|nr:F0F1 ATP synthase subunit B [Bacillota bacterium]HOP69604.1 F0F1 ATP synthase subunit B [Bacillota bacterium]HPT34839.1 F0F1 ATP synthase subunit B [Bacillota bacterium]HPZ64977.1 F0F1 ATP synthase subunit B [Bacillota bacterium]HQD06287.1 F0F1 ATP synthase subunit B [Bacillota bacterium]